MAKKRSKRKASPRGASVVEEKQRPGWLARFEALAAIDEVFAARGIEWVREPEPHASEMPLGTLWPATSWQASCAFAEGKLAVASGPAWGPDPEGPRGAWYVDPAAPGELWLALSREVAPMLWIPVAPAADAIDRALASIAPRALDDAEPAVHRRALMGFGAQLAVPNVYTGQLVEATVSELTNYWLFNPYRGRQSFAARTTYTGSTVGIEVHASGWYVWNLTYRPAPHAAIVEHVSALCEARFPLDAPLDVVGCLLGFGYLERAALEAELVAADARALAEFLPAIAALRYQDDDLEAFLAEHAESDDADVRRSVAYACLDYGVAGPMPALAARESDAELRAQLLAGHPADAPLVAINPIR